MREMKPKQTAEQPQVLYIDGCKVTLRYSGQKNPSAIKNIRNALISGKKQRKPDFLHFL